MTNFENDNFTGKIEMDLNEKLAKRRKEREMEANVILKEIAFKELALKEAQKIKIIDELAQKRLAEKGYPGVQDNVLINIESKEGELLSISDLRLNAKIQWYSDNFVILILLILCVIFAFYFNIFIGIISSIIFFMFNHDSISQYYESMLIENGCDMDADNKNNLKNFLKN